MATFRRWKAAGLAAALGLVAAGGIAPAPAFGQVRERDVTITGPRGRSVERKLESVRGPGFLDRQTTITRPGGTFTRDVRIQNGPGFVSGGFRGGWAGPRGGWGPPGRVLIERPVFVGGGGGLSSGASFGLGAGLGALFGTAGGLLLGSAISNPPPPPVVVAPAPVYVAPAGVVPVAVAPVAVPAQPAPPAQAYAAPAAPGFDPVADAVGRLSSRHTNSRRDGALTLGRIGDPRAVPALVDRLKNDTSKDVRIAAATALGQIGDPGSAVVLQRAIVYDKKQEVRDAAAAALARMPREVLTGGTAAAPPGTVTSTPAQPTARVPEFRPVDPQPQPSETPPPPPTPAVVPDLRGPRS